MPVTIASSTPYSWTGRALDADPNVSLQRLTLAQLATVNVEPDALVVVEGACPDALPGHDLLILSPPLGQCLGIDVKPVLVDPQLTSWETADPRFRFLTMDGVHLARAHPLEGKGASASLVRAGKVTVVADASIPGRTATVVGFDVGESDWPLKASFVLFVRNVVEQARMHRMQGATGPAKTGDPLRIAVPNGVTRVKVEAPGALESELSAKGGFVVVPEVLRAGIYRVRWTEPRFGSELVVVNLTSEKESDVRARPITIDATTGSGPPPQRKAEAHREWTPWLALFAALVLVLDVWWLTRRVKRSAPVPIGGKA
jgi:hypothetical protein